jgi:hypothetical protein
MALRYAKMAGCAVLALFTACMFNPDNGPGTLRLNISHTESLSKSLASGPSVVEHLWITIKEVQVHTSGGDGWQVAAAPGKSFDFLELVNGLTVPLEIYPLAPGHYTQLRLLLEDINEIVIDGETSPITIPSGLQTGIKLVRQFKIEEGEETEICIDFDIEKAVHTASGENIMHPTYKTIKCDDDQDDTYPLSEPIPPETEPPAVNEGDEEIPL